MKTSEEMVPQAGGIAVTKSWDRNKVGQLSNNKTTQHLRV